MTLNTDAKKEFVSYETIAEGFELSMKVLSWAHLNFQLQSFLLQTQDDIPREVKAQLDKIGYQGEDIRCLSKHQFNKLFEKESFFSASQTGKRIAAFALKENGLNQNRFSVLEESIFNAYIDVKKEQGSHPITDKSYQHCLDTLSVFKL